MPIKKSPSSSRLMRGPLPPREEDILDEIRSYISKIDYDIGYYTWKVYIYCAFWSNISTPINLAITVLTAITTGQSATQSLLTAELTTQLSFAVLFISIFNTFFRPNDQLSNCQLILKVWTDLGVEFESIYFDRVYTYEERAAQLKKYEALFVKVNAKKRDFSNNFLIDFVFIFINCFCIRSNIFWLRDINSDDPENRRLPHALPHTAALAQVAPQAVPPDAAA